MNGIVETPVAATQTAEDQALATIASVGKPSIVASAATPAPEATPPVAPVAPTPTPDPLPPTAPSTGQVQPAPAEAGQPAAGGAETPTDPNAVADPSVTPPLVEQTAEEKAKAFDEALGLPPETVETADLWREKATAATQEAARIATEREAQLGALGEMGLTLVHVGDGKFELAPTDEYKGEFNIDDDIDLAKLIKPMSEEQRDAMLTDPNETFAKLAKGIAKKVGLELLTKRPPVKAGAQKPLLTEHETSGVYNTFVDAKRPDGTTPLYPDADKPEIQSYMARIWNAGSPAMDAVRDAAGRDQGVYMAAMELCYYKAAFGLANAKERIRLAGKQASDATQQNQNEPSVSAGNAGSPPAATPTATFATAEDEALSIIGKAKPA